MQNLSNSDLDRGRDALLAGDPHTALAILGEFVAAAPADIEGRYWLASAALTAGVPNAAAALDDARTLHALLQLKDMGGDLARLQTDAPYAAGVADQLYGRKLVAMSAVVRRMAISLGGADTQGLLSYALALQHQGRPEEACEIFRLAAESHPAAPVHQFQIYPQLLCDNGDTRHSVAAQTWAELYAPESLTPPLANPPRRGRKLRIGYVAPWFATSQVRQFIAPLLENHDPKTVSVTLYPTDAASEVGWPSWIDVHPIGALGDAQAAQLIRDDGVDVLADCWGHSAGSRLAVFGHRPAPVQVGWINFIQTTGLKQMDYILHADAAAMPEGLAQLYTEDIWRIGPVFNAFRPAEGRLPPAATPAMERGYVTFGSFNHPAKLVGGALDAWAAVLRGAPTSRLLLKYSYFTDPVLQRVTLARFAARGIAPERVSFAGHSQGDDYFRSFQDIDLMLDSWPAPGSTTTLDALSNGVPVLVMAEPTIPGIYARSILDGLGLPELITTSADAFVARAFDLTGQPRRLDELRSRIRPAFDASPYRDEAAFTRRIETAFAQMFDLWRDQAPGARASA